jgi:hypothetical protein
LPEIGAELVKLWVYDQLAIRLLWVLFEVIVMVRLGLIKHLKRDNLRAYGSSGFTPEYVYNRLGFHRICLIAIKNS